MRRLVRFLQLRLLWPILLLLAAFVIFFQLIAEVGGSADPLPWPPVEPLPTASPSPTEQSEPSPVGPSHETPSPPMTPPGGSVDR